MTQRPAVLVIEEAGSDIEWRELASAPFQDITSRPPRHGVAAWNVGQPRSLSLRVRGGRVGAAARAELICHPTADVAALPLCLAFPGLWPAVSGMKGSSTWCDALTHHAGATAAARGGNNHAALSEYRLAAKTWHARGDGLREGAALLGAAEILLRMDRYEEAIAEAQRSEQRSREAGNTYFALRARGEICLSYRELGRRSEGRDCQSAVARDFLRAGENADAANAYISLGSMSQDDGQTDAARPALAALDSIDGSDIPPEVVARGRLLRADVSMYDGRIVDALAELELAVALFLRIGNKRWIANTYMRLAGIYAQLGSFDEGRRFATSALAVFSAQHSPAGEALALRLLGVIDSAEGADAAAEAHFSRARARLMEARLPTGLLALDAVEASARRDDAALQRALSALESGETLTARQKSRLQLAQAWRALRTGDTAIAMSHIARASASGLSFADYLRSRALRARLLAAAGKAHEGFSSLNEDIERLRDLISTVEAPALRFIAGRRLGELRAAWVDLYAQASPADRPDSAVLWMMLQKTLRLRLLGGGNSSGPPANEVDRRLTQLFFLETGDESGESHVLGSQRDLLRFYLQPRSRTRITERSLPSLQQLQYGLPPEGRLIAFAFGEERLLRLDVTQTDVTVSVLDPLAAVREAASRLRRSLASATTPLAEVRSDISRLSQSLFAGEQGAAPERLFVMFDGELGGIPFSLLEWPGTGTLLDGTAVSVVPTGIDADSFQPLPMPRTIRVLTSSLRGSGNARLPPLDAADLDTEPLRRTMIRADFVAHRDEQFTRQRLFDALAMPDSWLHVAAHGSNDPSLQSYSGLWIAPAGAETSPSLVSWLELSERGVQSDLLVLSSCGLGGDPVRSTSGAASFAAAMNAAGARNVVAALWPVSDIAAAQFAQTFYSELVKSPRPDVARAVAAAQRRVRENPHFRHPYYWSLFIHLQR